MSYTLEMLSQIWNDKDGDRIEVGPDRDGLDLIEIRYVDENSEIHDRITLTAEQLPLVIEALEKCKQ